MKKEIKTAFTLASTKLARDFLLIVSGAAFVSALFDKNCDTFFGATVSALFLIVALTFAVLNTYFEETHK